ncbi:DNA/RNA non-specific endonuclease [Pseudofulvibacter geojedonensis]|uniref:DNA/RNA non-specific endonuclease n=1 Tax=Pseudofulvibacter geojedonensis TaxID=1123758 RepID=A0ABW3I448_9FLAO
MNSKTKYTIIAVVVLIAIQFVRWYVEEGLETKVITGDSTVVASNQIYLPTSTTGNIIYHNNYSLSYHEKFEQAEWVAYELKRDHLSNKKFKRPLFYQDESIKTKSAHWANFKNSGYDKGHLCPAGDRKFTKQAHDETFLTSNISPQEHQFNSGIWNRLEQKVRYWAKKYNGVFVITGGVLTDNLNTIGNEKVAVPKYFYKVLLDNNNGKIKMLAFLVPHQNSNKPLYEFVVSVDRVEQLTGIDFFPQIEDEVEEKLESLDSYKGWSFR